VHEFFSSLDDALLLSQQSDNGSSEQPLDNKASKWLSSKEF
jgi:hypothetical protein